MEQPRPETPAGPAPATHVVRRLLAAVAVAVAVYVVVPQLPELERGLSAFRSGRWPFLLLALVGSAGTYVAGAWMVRASAGVPVPWGGNVLAQVAASAAATMTPLGAGWVGVTEGFLTRQGVDVARARAATAVNVALTFASHLALLLVTVPFLGTLSLPTVTPPPRRVVVDVVAVVAVLVGVVSWVPRLRRRLVEVVRPVLAAVPDVVRDPRRSIVMVLGAVAGNVAYAVALSGSVAAFGPAPPFLGVLVAYLVAASVAAVSPTPGGLGAMEAALVSALTRLAVPGGQAVAAALTFRLATFWLPFAAGSVLLLRRRGQNG